VDFSRPFVTTFSHTPWRQRGIGLHYLLSGLRFELASSHVKPGKLGGHTLYYFTQNKLLCPRGPK
jgi:hypothetical protein